MSDGPLSPEEVAHRGFGTTFRGFDTAEVRAYLQRVANDLREGTARERDLHRRLADAEYRAAHPVIEGDALTRALGDEMGRILVSAQEAANGLKDKAEENAARILRDAHDQAQRIRAQAEAILAMRTEEADAEAAKIRRAAETEAAQLVARADEQATAAMAEVEGRARQLVRDAQAARARVLGDLTRRRRLLQTQVEQLRAGRDRLLEAYRKVRSTTDEVADELQRVEDEAREAAGAARERAAAGAAGDDIDEALLAFADTETDTDTDAGVTEAPDDTAGAGGQPGQGGPGQPDPASSAPAGSVPFAVKADVAAQVADQAADDAEQAALAAEAAAVEAAQGAGGDEADPPPQVVSTRPGGERRPLRLLRRPRSESPVPDAAAGRSGDEVVRVLPPPPEPLVDAAASSIPGAGATDLLEAGVDQEHEGGVGEAAPGVEGQEAPPPAPDAGVGHDDAVASEATTVPEAGRGGADAAAAAVAGVDELFARIRAGRADAVARAHEVLTADPGAPVQLASERSGEPTPAEEPPAAQAGLALGEALLQRRDTAVDGLAAKVARKLKRALQDEQNEVLDRLRSLRAEASSEAVLPGPDEQAARFRQAAHDPLRAAAAAGVAFAAESTGTEAETPDVADVLSDLVSSLAEPLRRALERAVGGDGADQAAVGERIGAAYRECKAQRIEGLAGDAVTAAFALGALAAMPAGAASQWVVDDDGRPCPDCDDNALAGPTPTGEAFPTGQAHPPAHAGCRCLLAPSALASAR